MKRIEAIERSIENHLWHFGLEDCDKQLIHTLVMGMVDFAREAHHQGQIGEDFEQWVNRVTV